MCSVPAYVGGGTETKGGAIRAIRSGECVVTRTPPMPSSGRSAAPLAGKLDRRALGAVAGDDARRLHRTHARSISIDRHPAGRTTAGTAIHALSGTETNAREPVGQAHQEGTKFAKNGPACGFSG